MLHFLAAIIYIYLAIRIFSSDRISALNRTAVALLVCFALWSSGMTLMSIPNLPPGFIRLLWRVYPAGWITFPVFTLLLFLIMTEQKQIYNSPPVKFVFIFLPVFFFFLHSFNLLMNNPVLGEYGWYPLWKRNIWVILYYAYYISFTFAGIILIYRYALTVRSRILKKMSYVILAGSVSTLTLGSFNEVLLSLIFKNQVFFSQVTDIAVLIWAFSIMYAVTTYGFFKITPTSAADNIIANMNEFLILLNEEAQIEYANSHVLNFLGYKDKELAGKKFGMLMALGDDFNNMLKSVLTKGAYRFPEFYLKKKDGSRSPVVFSVALLKEMGDVVGFVCVASDISEVKKAEETLKESYDRLKELDDLKSNFTSVVSHELRTPLTSIKGFLQFLLNGIAGPVNAQQREYLDIIKNNSERLLSLINDLLDMSKMESGKFTVDRVPSAVKPLLERCVKDVRSLSDAKNITISVETSEPGAVLNIDPYRISQAVINLLSNAIKFSQKNSAITAAFSTVDLGGMRLPAHVKPRDLKPGNYGLIVIKDLGLGIEADKLVKVFDRFYQVENANTRKTPGTGLGLNIVRNIVEQHNGIVWAESEGPGKGSEFKILLPAEVKS
jgi:PAS domain S-box-containing protein